MKKPTPKKRSTVKRPVPPTAPDEDERFAATDWSAYGRGVLAINRSGSRARLRLAAGSFRR